MLFVKVQIIGAWAPHQSRPVNFPFGMWNSALSSTLFHFFQNLNIHCTSHTKKSFFSPSLLPPVFLLFRSDFKSHPLSFLSMFLTFHLCANPVFAQCSSKAVFGEDNGALIDKMNGDFSVLLFLTSLLYLTTSCFLKTLQWGSLVAQWLRICLPMQGTRVRALVWEDPICRGATRPVSHNY